MPDPHLKKAMAEIKKLLERFRIGGCITLVSRTHAEFRYQFPVWSVVQPESGPHGEAGIFVRSFKAWYRSTAEQKQAMEASLHCLYQMRDSAGHTFMVMDHLIKQVEQQAGFEITHTAFSGFEPHTDDQEP